MAPEEYNPKRFEQGAGTSNTIILPAIEQAAVKDLITALEQDLTALTSTNGSDNTADISAKRHTLQALHVAIAPHKRVPYEVWTHIFMQTLHFHDKDQELYLHISNDVRDNPFYLRQVCSFWRRIVTSYTPLSNRILLAELGIASRVEETREWDAMITLAKEIIPSTGPLYFSVTHDYEDEMEEFMYQLVSEMGSRIKALSVTCLPRAMDHVLRQLDYLPSLDTLDLDFISGDEAKPWMLEYRGLNYLTSIRKFSLSNVAGSPLFNQTFAKYLKWKQLTHLELDPQSCGYLHPVQVFRALSRCENLITCYVTFWEDDMDPYWDEESSDYDDYGNSSPKRPGKDLTFDITLPHLRSLRVRTTSCDPFTSLTVPSLKELEVSRSCAMPAEEICSMIERSSCRLTKYTDTLEDCYKDTTEELFNVSLLTRLEDVVEFSSYIPLGIEQLEKISNGVLLPNATTLGARAPEDVSPEEMINILRPRSMGGSETSSAAVLNSIQLFVDYAVFKSIAREDFDQWLGGLPASTGGPRELPCFWCIAPVDEPEEDSYSCVVYN